jgi:hypothetical protein
MKHHPRVKFQSSLATEHTALQKLVGDISILAPTRGATCLRTRLVFLVIISIHAPARGATCHRYHCTHCYCYFNPRPRKRSDFNFV